MLQEENQRILAKLERAAQYIAQSDAIRSSLLTERKQLANERNAAFAKVKKVKDNSAEIERVSIENQTAENRTCGDLRKDGQQDGI